MQQDLTFFTNEPGATLLDRFRKALKYTRYFDILVGYFRTSGFYDLYEAFESIEKIRILVGLNVDRPAFEIIDSWQHQQTIDFTSHKHTKEVFSEHLIQEMDSSPDNFETEVGVRKFVEFLRSGRLEIKAYPGGRLHAKVYISRFPDDALDFGRVITGSSNFSDAGLVANREFNVELKNSVDVEFALKQFEELWKDAVDISQDYVDTIRERTWLNDRISPYQLYLKLLYEYFREDINLDEDIAVFLPEGFRDLDYQKQAVLSAQKILFAYNGVFLADVVGLGKTFIAALLAQQLPGKILVICPPVLQDYWRETFFEFGVRRFQVASLGKLDMVIKEGAGRFDYVFVDEAHRFRNELTQGYEKLHQICFGKKVILVSATPLNNTVDDIFSQLKLFQAPKKSTIPGVPNLEKFFAGLKRRIERHDRSDPAYLPAVKEVYKELREKVLKHVMVRRTRTEVVRFFQRDMQQGMTFPEVADPNRIVYAFDTRLDAVFNQTIALLRDFTYSRYTPLLFLKKPVDALEAQSQRNIGGFMKGILVKRLESSFHAFGRSLTRFIVSYERFIDMLQRGTVYISKRVNVYDFLDADDEQALLDLVEQEKVQRIRADEFREDFVTSLNQDLGLLRRIKALWVGVTGDPKLGQFMQDLQRNPVLKKSKLIVFTESQETGAYLFRHLEGVSPGKVLFYSSTGGMHADEEIGVPLARDLIKENFDPLHRVQKNDVRILVTTDVLAEGINLHRANVVLNYDLPWNPTRVLQRVGRVNRVGTEHERLYVFNFFPTAQADAHLGLESAIKAKIQAFHDSLGEDARYLTEEEEVSTHELFGDRLYARLHDRRNLEGEEEGERSELEYLQIIREVRDRDPALFETVKRLPKKARSSRALTGTETDQVVTFFRKDKLKKFLAADDKEARELTFLEAVDLFECAPDTVRHPLPKAFFPLLDRNKAEFDRLTSGESIEIGSPGSRSNESYIAKRLRAREIRLFQGFTDEDEEFIQAALKAFDRGVVPRNTSKRLKQALEKEIQPLKVLGLLRRHLPPTLLAGGTGDTKGESHGRQVILSEFLLGGER